MTSGICKFLQSEAPSVKKDVHYSSERYSADSRWSTEEVTALLSIIKRRRIARIIDRTRQRNEKIFMTLERDMRALGCKKSWGQIREKWKYMKRVFIGKYYRGEDEDWPHYEQMHHLLQHRFNETRKGYNCPPGEELEPPILHGKVESPQVATADCESESFFAHYEIQDDETAEQEQEDYTDQFHEFLDVIKSEGEKDRRSTMMLVDAMLNSLSENVDRLISATTEKPPET